MALLPMDLVCPRCGQSAHAPPGTRCPGDGAFLVAVGATDPLVGRELAPDLLLFGVLSDGGFSRVYRAAQLRLAREVVVKVLRPAQAADETGRARFLQEARLLAELGDEPRVVGVHDCGEVDGLFYLVLARAPGRPLADILRAERLAEDRAIGLMREILGALEAVHARGQVHRDLKPDNVIVQGDRVTLIDFGIAKVLNPQEDSPRTASEVSLGTPRYMAPEQLQRGGEIGPWTDVYAAGALLYELLTGHPPFEGSAAELVGAHLYQPPPELPGAYGPVVARALAKRPEDRYPDARALGTALANAGEGGTKGTGIIALSPTIDALERVPRRRWPWAVAAVMVAGAGALLWPRPEPATGLARAPVDAGGEIRPAAAPAAEPDAAGVAPATVAPETAAPETAAPETAPVRAAPDTEAPEATAPETTPPRRPARAPTTTPPSAAPPTAAPPTAAPPTAAPPTAAPPPAAPAALVRRLREALRTCACDRARSLLAEAAGTTDHAALRAEVERCRPKLPGLACRYEGP